jgi:hypothetical protein
MAHMRFDLAHVPHVEHRGDGYFAGLAPDPADPDSPDGRFRILNVPARGRITVHERSTMRCIAETLSATDGTWSVLKLSRAYDYTVIGWDDRGTQNAAIQDWVRPAPME